MRRARYPQRPLGYMLGDVNVDPGMSFPAFDPSKLPYQPTPQLQPVGISAATAPVSPSVTAAVVQSSSWPSWATYAAIGAGVLAVLWLASRR